MSNISETGRHETGGLQPFTGTFTEETRRRLRERRLELGLTHERLACLFNVNWSTVRKWENGTTRRCALFCRPLVADFLSGALDHLVRPVAALPAAQAHSRQMSDLLLALGDALRMGGLLDPLTLALIERLRQRLGLPLMGRR